MSDADLARYYAQRAESYERIYQKPERQVELRALEAWLPGVFAGRRVLEIACGTGWWTPHGARDAAAWRATDLNPETLAIARTKALPACVQVTALKESDAYPAMAERGYGWEKLISEMFCQEYWAERGMKTAIARFHNVYGPWGTWDGGREKAPAAICRKVIQAIDKGDLTINIWGDGSQTRSFMYIDDCIKGIDMIMHSDDLIATPINLGSSEMVSINTLVSKVEKIAGVKLKRSYDLSAPRGVAGRNSDNTFIKKKLKWEPNTPLDTGLKATYAWIKQQFDARKKGKRVVE